MFSHVLVVSALHPKALFALAMFQVSIECLDHRDDKTPRQLDFFGEVEEEAEEPVEEAAPDWRVENARATMGASLIRRAYRRQSANWDHDHCCGCWAKFMETDASDVLTEGYATYTEYDWVCGNCYEELRHILKWKLAPARMAQLLARQDVRLRVSRDNEWIPEIRTLFLEYANSLGVDLAFQDFERELANLPGEYNRALGKGSLLVALLDGKPVGCVGVRPLHRPQSESICEMKRLYVRLEARGTGLGEALARAVIDEGRRLGYSAMRLDSLPGMDQAIQLYSSLGFRQIEPYRYNPIEGSVFMELQLEV